MQKLFMLLLGAYPKGRLVEQHDIYIGIAENVKDLVPFIVASWLAATKIHVDAWRTVTHVDGYDVQILLRNGDETNKAAEGKQLFFLNLGGYKPGEMEEFHYKMIVAANNKTEAIQQAKSTAFFKHVGFKGAPSHIDEKYGIDVDDIFEIVDILPPHLKAMYKIVLTENTSSVEDELHIGYFKLDKL